MKWIKKKDFKFTFAEIVETVPEYKSFIGHKVSGIIIDRMFTGEDWLYRIESKKNKLKWVPEEYLQHKE